MVKNIICKGDEIIPTIKETGDPSSYIIKPTKNQTLSIINMEQSDNPIEVCSETSMDFTRIYLLRHLPYLDSIEHNLYEDLRTKLKEFEKEEKSNDDIDKELRESYGDFYKYLIKKVEGNIYKLFGQLDDNLEIDFSKADTVLLDRIFKDQENTIFIYNGGDSKKRIDQSIKYIKEKYPDIKLETRNIIGSIKGIDKQEAVLKAGIELVDIIKDIKTKISENNPEYVGKNIVILGSRSHSHFLNSNKFDKVGKDTSEKEFEEKGYDLIDLDSKSTIIDNNNVLKINPGNYQEMISIFPNIEQKSIIDLHKKVNALFSSHNNLFEKYLFSNNSEVRLFCAVNLIQNGKFDIIKEKIIDLINIEEETKIINFTQTVFDSCNKDQKKEILKILKNEKNLLSNVKLGKLEYLGNYNSSVIGNMDYLREKTQDENIRNGALVSISVGFNEEKYNEIDNLLCSNNIILIEATAGSGKSIKLLEILEYLSPKEETEKNNRFPIYVHLGKHKRVDDIKDVIDNQIKGIYGKGLYKYIYLFDAIDEAGMDNKEKEDFLTLVKDLQKKGKVIITSRKLHISDNDLEKIELNPLTNEQIKTYLESYILGNIEQENLWKKWQENGFIKEIENNPLMLSMLVELIKNTDKVKKLEKYGFIENLKIEKKSDLFDIIVTLRLYEGEIKKTKDYKNIDENDIGSLKERINRVKKILEFIAVESVEKVKNLSKLDIESYILKEELFLDKAGRSELLENLNLIYKYNSDTDKYQFVHEKFKEYFLFVNYRSIIKWKKNITYEEYLVKEMTYISNKKITVLNNKNDIDLSTIDINPEKLAAIGFNSFYLFTLTVNRLLNKYGDNNWNIFYKVLLAINKYKTEESLSILKEYFKNILKKNKGYIDLSKIQIFCESIGEIGIEEGLDILEMFIKIDGLFKERNMLSDFCETITKIGSEKGLDLIDKIINENSAKIIIENINSIILTIGKLKSEKGYELLLKIIKIPGIFKIKDVKLRLYLSLIEITSINGIDNLPIELEQHIKIYPTISISLKDVFSIQDEYNEMLSIMNPNQKKRAEEHTNYLIECMHKRKDKFKKNI